MTACLGVAPLLLGAKSSGADSELVSVGVLDHLVAQLADGLEHVLGDRIVLEDAGVLELLAHGDVSGVHVGDGGVDVFHSAKVPAGAHRLSLKLNDSVRVEGFNFVFEEPIDLAPAQILLVGFDKERGFVLRGVASRGVSLFVCNGVDCFNPARPIDIIESMTR